MNKLLLGLLLGGVLGAIDGTSALVYPGTAPMIVSIIIGSTCKGMITGISAGFFARKVNSLPLGIVFGLGLGFLLSLLVATTSEVNGKHPYFEIILPGSLLGAIVGFATQRWPRAAAAAR